MNETLTRKWSETRGISVVSIAMNPVSIPDEDAESIKKLQRAAALSNPALAAGALTGAQADAMRTAAANTGGAMTGFMGMGMAANAGGVNAQALYGMAAEQKAAAAQQNASSWDLLLRRGKRGQLLLRVRQAQTCRRSDIQM